MQALNEAGPFHAGELAAQRKAGVDPSIREVGAHAIRSFMPDQHRRFYEQLTMLFIGAIDPGGSPWATVVVGEPGFIRTVSPTQLVIGSPALLGDPAAQGLVRGASIGLLGIDLATRRRNRVNGRVLPVNPDGLRVSVEQAFGNCPQYIQQREAHWVRPAQETRPREVRRLTGLDASARALIARSDTFFVATNAPRDASDVALGADLSHRGGKPGFVHVDDDGSLLIPDYGGNSYFMTLGNLLVDPRAGLLFVDFELGDVLTMTGTAEVLWDKKSVEAFAGAERAWRFRATQAVWMQDVLPLRWKLTGWSPNTLLTGTWQEARDRQQAVALAQAWRPWRVTRIEDESSVIRSFYLTPADGGGLPSFDAGKFLPIRLCIGGHSVTRTYTISSAPMAAHLRLSVKREGLASTHLHDCIRVGDVIEAQRPRGHFTIDPSEPRHAVLIGAGVGITPMMAFLHHLISEGVRHRRTRPVTLIQVARNRAVSAFAHEIEDLVARSNGSARYVPVFDEPADGAMSGPLTVEALQRIAPMKGAASYYLCGPGGFMQALYDGLRTAGIDDGLIHAESFGPATLQRWPQGCQHRVPTADAAEVVFARSGKSARWTRDAGTLLAFAEAQGLDPPFSCRHGTCGTCLVNIQSGQVAYETTPAWPTRHDEVLPCCARPAAGTTTITLDL